MKQWIGLVTIALFGGGAFAAPVDAEKAAAVALAFAEQNMILAEHTEGVGEATSWENVWVVPLKPSGYVVVEKDDIRPPVIAFGKEDFPKSPAPPMAEFLERPAMEEGLTTFSTLSATPAHEEWAILLEPSLGLETLAASPTPPTEGEVKTYSWEIEDFTYAWNQILPYNLYAPGLSRARLRYVDKSTNSQGDFLVSGSDGTYGLRAACGCGATAISQVAAWFQWPYALRGVTACGHKENEWNATRLSDINYATYQVATPGKPYDWGALNRARTPSVIGDPDREEVGRFVQHWATVFDMAYFMDTTGGTLSNLSHPDLLLLAGYKIVSPECVGIVPEPVEGEPGKWEAPMERKPYSDAALETLYGAFFKAIHTYRVPTAAEISGHFLVCDGWAEEADTALSPDTRYVKLNYGWGPMSGENGWFALRNKNNAGDGETVADDNKIFLWQAFTVLPLQCGEIVELSKKGPVPSTLKWYESPYWRNNYLNAKRRLQVVTFGESVKPHDLSLEAAAMSDANWVYTPATTEASERLEVLSGSTGLKTAVFFPELLKRGPAGETLSITVGLERMQYQKVLVDANGTPVLDKYGKPTFIDEFADIPDDQARKLLLALEDVETGMLLYTTEALVLKDDKTTCTVTIPADKVPEDKVFRVLLRAGDSLADKEALSIPVDSVAYAVTGVTVVGSCSSTTTQYEFNRVMTEGTQPGALTQGTLPTLAEAKEGETLWLAVTITDTGMPAHDALWKPLTIAEKAVALPTIDFVESHLFLNDLDTEIAFTMDGYNITNVTAYLSQGSWLMSAEENPADVAKKVDYRNGFKLTTDEINNREFKLAGRAYTGTGRTDALTLGSPETVGRDTMLSLCATDDAGNQAWTHTRMTWGLSKGIIDLLETSNRKLVELYLDRLLVATLYAGCYELLPIGEGEAALFPTEESEANVKDPPKEEQMEAAIGVIEDAIRLGYGTEGSALTSSLYVDLICGKKVLNPRVEVLGLSSKVIIFKISDDVTSSATLARYVDTAIIVEGGETLDAMKQLLPEEVELSYDLETGIYTLILPEDKKFFQIKL